MTFPDCGSEVPRQGFYGRGAAGAMPLHLPCDPDRCRPPRNRAPSHVPSPGSSPTSAALEGSFSENVIREVRRIPYGKVTSYGDIAARLGTPRAARGVGHTLSSLPEGSDVPWWRVVNRNGEISIRHIGGRIQRMMLEQEGVWFGPGGRIDLERFRWRAPTEEIEED